MAQNLQLDLRHCSPKLLVVHGYKRLLITLKSNSIKLIPFLFLVQMISSEASKRDDYNAYCAGKKVGRLRARKYIDRDRLIANLD